MAGEGVNVGEIFGRLGFRVDQSGSQQWDRTRQKAETDARKPIVQQLGFQVDDRALSEYRRKLDEVKARNARRDDFKAKLGADYDPKAFRAYERDLAKAEREAQRLTATTSQQSRSFDTNRASVEGATKAFRSLFDQAAKITALGVAAQGLSALGAGAGAAASGLAPLSGVLAAYPALASAAGQGIGVFQLATSNIADAVGGLNERLDENAKAFRELDPQAQRIARRLDDLKQPIRDLSKEAQRGLFPGLEDGINSLDRLMPTVQTIVGDTAKALGGLAREAGSLLASWGPDLETQGRRNVRWIKEGGDAAIVLANAARNVVLAAGPLTDWIVKQANAFAHLIDRQAEAGRQSGALAGFFKETRAQMDRVVRIAGDVAGALFNIGKQAYPLGNDLLKSLTKNADKFREWTDSARGKNAIKDYFDRARPAIYELSELIKDVTTTFFQLGSGDQVAPLLRTVRTRLLPAFATLVDSTTKAFGPPFLEAVAQALELFTKLGGSSGPLVAFTKLLGTALSTINEIIDRVPVIGTLLAAILATGGIYKALNIAASLTGVKALIGLLGKTKVAAAEAGAAGAASGAVAGGGRGGGLLAVAGRLRGNLILGAGLAAAAGFSAIQGGREEKAIKALNAQIDRLVSGRNLDGLRALRREFEQYGSFPGGIDQARKAIDNATRSVEDMRGATEGSVGEMRRSFHNLRRFTTADMDDIQGVVRRNMRRIRDRLGTDSAEGQAAVAENFRRAARAVQRQMDRGEISTRDGMKAIRGYLAQELQVYGLSISQARNIARGNGRGGQYGDADQNLGREGGAPIARATGGMASPYGGGGADDHILIDPAGRPVAAMSGTEGVINRPQMAVIDQALAITQALGLGRYGGLGELWGSGMRHFAGGGQIVPVPGFPGERANRSILDEIAWVHRSFGLTLTDAFGQGHKSPGHTVTGTAADFAGADSSMDRAVQALVRAGYLVGYDGRFGSQAWPGHGPSSVAGSNAHLHVEFGSGGGGMLAAVPELARQVVRGGGAVGRVVQGALDVARGGAQGLLRRASAASLAIPTAGGHGITGGYSKGQLAGLWRQAGGPGNVAGLMAAIALAESGGDPRAHNPSGATGLWQILGNPFPGNAYDPLTNARMAVSKYRSQGLGAWEAYTNGNYRGYLKRGGLLRRFNGGGLLNTASGIGNTSHPGTAGGSPYSIRSLRHRQGDRVQAYEDVLGKIEDDRKHYEQTDRLYGQSDEELIDQDGNINQAAIRHRLDELGGLKAIRDRIKRRLQEARKIARRIVRTYGEIIKRLRGSLRHAKNKDRKGIRAQIKTYVGRRGEWRDTVKQLGSDITDAGLDVGDIQKEINEVAGTTAEASTAADELGDTGGADTGGGGLTPDQQAQLDQASQLKQIVDTGNFLNTAALQTLGVFDPNRVGEAGYGGAPAPAGGPAGGTRSAMTLSDGTEVPAGGVVHLTQLTVNTLHPGDPQTLMAIAGAANAGNSYRGGVPSPRKVLGV